MEADLADGSAAGPRFTIPARLAQIRCLCSVESDTGSQGKHRRADPRIVPRPRRPYENGSTVALRRLWLRRRAYGRSIGLGRLEQRGER